MACVFFGNDSKGLALVSLAQYTARIKKTWLWNGSNRCFIFYSISLKNYFVLLGTASCFADTNMCKTSCVKDPSAQL